VAVDSNVPRSFFRNFLDANPTYQPGQNEETDALFNPSIQARPLHIPMTGQIRRRLRSDLEFFWAFDRNGQNPYHQRCEQLRAVGFEYATTQDVDMAVADTVKGPEEIRNGDLRLMKIPKQRWLEVRKSQLLEAILMTNPRGKVMNEDRTVMSVGNLIPGVKTTLTEEPLPAAVAVSDAAQDLRDGVLRGNASVVPKNVVNKGVR